MLLACLVPRRRHDLLLSCALDLLDKGDSAAAMLAVEYVCRSKPTLSIPALLRASMVQHLLPSMAAAAWSKAWERDPEQPLLQDNLLRSLLSDGESAEVVQLGLAFLAQRCRSGSHASLVDLLRAAGLTLFGACWQDKNRIAAMLFSAHDIARTRLRLLSADGECTYEVPTGGQLFHLAPSHGDGPFTLLLSGTATAIALAGSPLSQAQSRQYSAGARLPIADGRRLVALILPLEGDTPALRTRLDNLLYTLPRNRTRLRLIVVDDGLSADTAAWLGTWASANQATLLRNAEPIGFVKSVNLALRICPADDVLLIPALAWVSGDWIDRLTVLLDSAADAAAVVPGSRQIDTAIDADRTPGSHRAAQGQRPVHEHAQACHGGVTLLSRHAIGLIGALDPRLCGNAAALSDWCERARAAGLRAIVASGVHLAHTRAAADREDALRRHRDRGAMSVSDLARTKQPPSPASSAPRARSLVIPDELEAAGQLRLRLILAALPGHSLRIGVWRHVADSVHAAAIMLLARRLSARDTRSPPIRLLVLGEAIEALWRTGVVDVIPPAGEADTLFDDTMVLGLAGCTVLLAPPGVRVPQGIAVTRMAAGFDALAWLSEWERSHASAGAALTSATRIRK